MTTALADTSVFIAIEQGRTLRAVQPDNLRLSCITLGELWAGVLSAGDVVTRSRRMVTLNRAQRLKPLPVDDLVAGTWAELRLNLRDQGRRMAINDSWIAATALAYGLPVATHDDDFDVVEGLTVLKL